MPPVADPRGYAQARLGAQRGRFGSPFTHPGTYPGPYGQGPGTGPGISPNIQQAYGTHPHQRQPPQQPQQIQDTHGMDPTAAFNNVARAFANRPAAGVVPNQGAVAEPTPQGPADSPTDPNQLLMTTQGNTPIYYGTPEARQLAIEGLRRVVRGYGWNHPRTQSALQAALGVLGPDFADQIQPDYFKSPQGIRQPNPAFGFGPQMP